MKIHRSKQLFFNYATVSPVTHTVYMAVKKYWDAFYKIGPPEVLYTYDPLADDVATEAAKLLNCTAEEITYTKNTTEGIVIASEALPLQNGDEVLVIGEEYPANLLPWLKKRQDGITVKVISHLHGPEAVALLVASISKRTRVITMSSAQYYDGYMADLHMISQAARDNNAYFVVDAVQTIGIRKLDLSRLHIDILACGGQKFLQAGPGIGFMYINKSTLPSLKDYKPGIRSMQSYTYDAYTVKNTAARYQDGTQNLAGIVALHASLKAINKVGIDSIEAKNRRILDQIKVLLSAHDITFIDHGENQSNIIALSIPNAGGLVTSLRNQNVILKQINDIARISFNADTKMSDAKRLVSLIDAWRKRQV